MKIIDIKPYQNVEIITNADGSRCIKIEDVQRKRLSELEPGETFKISEWDFIVLEQQYGQTIVISKYNIGNPVLFGDTRNYKESNLRRIIEEDILPEVKREVGEHNIKSYIVDLTSLDMQNEFSGAVCKMFPITFGVARKYNNLLVNKELSDWYWTVTPWTTPARGSVNRMVVVAPSGRIDWSGCSTMRNGVRPMCYLNNEIEVRI